MTPCNIPAADLLPHTAPMVLLDTVVGESETQMRALAHIERDHPFAEDDGIASHIGLELMAQTCGTWAGMQARKLGQPMQKGMLLGTRNYNAEVEIFAYGTDLISEATLTFRDGEMAVFDCRILGCERLLASASLTLYQSADGSLAAQA